MTLDEYQQKVMRTASGSKDGVIPRAAVFALGLTGEAGEVADLLKKHWGHGHELNREKLKKELGDVLWYVAALAQDFGYTLEEIGRANNEKLDGRYKEGFTHEASRARIDEDIQETHR